MSLNARSGATEHLLNSLLSKLTRNPTTKVSGVLEVEVHADNLPEVEITMLPMTLNVTLLNIFGRA